MKLRKKDIKIETKRGEGPGGQHRNMTDSCVVATHTPTGISVKIDERNQHANKRKAIAELTRRVDEHFAGMKARRKKARRDAAIHEHNRIRTYDFRTGVVTDHRSGKKASLKDVLFKGQLEKLR